MWCFIYPVILAQDRHKIIHSSMAVLILFNGGSGNSPKDGMNNLNKNTVAGNNSQQLILIQECISWRGDNSRTSST